MGSQAWASVCVRVCSGAGRGERRALGKPGRLSLNPLSHMAQLSVASDHSPTMMGMSTW